MNTEYTLQATKRDNKGTSSSKKIRKNNGIPAVVYGDKDNNNIILDANEVAKQIKDSGFYSNVIQLKIDKKTVDVILKDLQRDPTKSSITHMDFFAVDKNKAVVVNVPIIYPNSTFSSTLALLNIISVDVSFTSLTDIMKFFTKLLFPSFVDTSIVYELCVS